MVTNIAAISRGLQTRVGSRLTVTEQVSRSLGVAGRTQTLAITAINPSSGRLMRASEVVGNLGDLLAVKGRK